MIKKLTEQKGGLFMKTNRYIQCIMVLLMLLLPVSCASLKDVMNLAEVKFSFDHVSSVRVGGIDVMNVRSVREINMAKVARATLMVTRGNLPLEMTVHVKTENPLINTVAATLVAMDWTLMLDGRKTISGTLNERVTLPAGQPQTIPLRFSLNMVEFFNEKNALDMLDLALAIAGENGKVPQGVALKIRPTIQTPLGVIRYRETTIKPAG